MYSLHLKCVAEQVEEISFLLWEAGTVAIREDDKGGVVELVAGFDDSADQAALATTFASYSPEWEREDDTDWVAETQKAWPPRELGERLFLAPQWDQSPTPSHRVRVIHNPGLASGTGEHPCTQLALEELERCIHPGDLVIDLGTGSGILSLAALRLGARMSVGLDLDIPSLACARENFDLNGFRPTLVAGSAACVASEAADVLVANISGTVLLAMADELLRIKRPGGCMILTGFPESELAVLQQVFGEGRVSEVNEWRCLAILY